MSVEQPAQAGPGRIVRAAWLVVGLLAVAIGAIGIVVPGMPTTVCFIVAAWCFSRSSHRLERWVLGLPRIGPMVRDHRAGLGMPRRAKAMAVSMIVVAVALSVTVGIDTWPTRLVVLTLGAVGVVYVAARVPTRERVLQKRPHSHAGEVGHPSPAQGS
ncbi:MAG: YbaN family protein [Acidimicrobiia bacterium]